MESTYFSFFTTLDFSLFLIVNAGPGALPFMLVLPELCGVCDGIVCGCNEEDVHVDVSWVAGLLC